MIATTLSIYSPGSTMPPMPTTNMSRQNEAARQPFFVLFYADERVRGERARRETGGVCCDAHKRDTGVPIYFA